MTPECPRPLRVDAIPPTGLTIDVVAGPAECAAIAARLGVPAVHALSGHFELHPEPGGAIHARGRFTARLDRTCVVSLEDFATTQRESFAVRFVPAGQESEDVDPESDDEIPYAGGSIDLGEALVEQVALDLDPYPRKPGARLPAGDTAAASPFAALAALRATPPEGEAEEE
jgi:uncharacterized metal-binding protein YceD (DUF177 family)